MEFAASACVSLTTITEHPPLAVWAVSAAWAAATLLALPAAEAAPPAIGRMEVNTHQCSFIARTDERQPCYRIELARKTEGVLRLRFIGQGEQKGHGRILTFVAINADQPLPVSCHQGQCELNETRWQGSVIGVAEAMTTGLGIADGLPKAWPAQGSCRLEQRRLACSAQLNTGVALSARARL